MAEDTRPTMTGPETALLTSLARCVRLLVEHSDVRHQGIEYAAMRKEKRDALMAELINARQLTTWI